MKQLFIVTVATDIIVVAEDAAEAEKFAIKATNDGDLDEFDAEASAFTHYPGGWDEKCLPFGYRDPAEPDRHIGGWIEAGAASHYVSRAAALEKLRAQKKTP